MAPLPPRDQRHPWLSYQVERYTEDIVHNYEQRLEMIFGRTSDTEMGLDVADTLCFSKVEIDAPEKVTGIDLFYLWSMDRGTANVPYLLAQYLFRYAEGRKSGARLFGGHFIGRLAAHFGLVSDEGLRGLLVITRELPMIDLHELVRLNICERLGDMWAWVAPGPERKADAAVDAPKATGDALVVDKGAPADPEPMQAPQPSHADLRTIPQRIVRLKEEVHELRRSIVGLHEDVDRSITNQSRFATWMVSCITQLMDASGRTYQAFDSTLVGSSRLPYQGCTRRRTGDTSTYTAQQDEQPDP
ncbi:hypothetical protein Tco_0976943 [Tanacetum coccineum]|uniref:Uncharacterized protein n=1 Tax=Tanacetum coccineum TaxID=301880 RepID=A0ABQ5EIP0_9ASTR